MAIIDYHSIRSYRYAQLSPSAKMLIPVLSCLCDDYTGEIPDEYSSAAALAAFAGMSERSVRAALQELASDQHKIIALDTKNGRIPSIQYRPVVRLGKAARMAQEKASQQDTSETAAEVTKKTNKPPRQTAAVIATILPDPLLGTDYPLPEADPEPPPKIPTDDPDDPPDDLGNDCRGNYHEESNPGNGFRGTPEMVSGVTSPEDTPQTPAITGENQNGNFLALNNSLNDLRTTTDKLIDPAFIHSMKNQFGEDVVVLILKGMDGILEITPGYFNNPAGYLRRCCQNQWVPTNKNVQEREKRKERKARVREEQEKSRQELDEMKRKIAQEQNDPEVMARIKAVQEAFLGGMSTPSQSIEGHVAVN